MASLERLAGKIPMKKRFGWLLVGCLLLLGYFFQDQLPQIHMMAIAKRLPQASPGVGQAETSDNQPTSEPMVTMAGPLAGWAQKGKSGQSSPQPSLSQGQGQGQRQGQSSHPSDHVGASPVGTAGIVLHKSFAVSTSTKFPFEIPAHAAMPHLHGTFRSFIPTAGAQSDPDDADIDFLILKEEQYADFASGRPSEALFSVEVSHSQDVNLSLPVSQDQPQKFYLIFRNPSPTHGKKLVEADFTVDF